MVYSLSSGMKTSSNMHHHLFLLMSARPKLTTRRSAWTSTTPIAKATMTSTRQVILAGHGLMNGIATSTYKKSFPRGWEWLVGYMTPLPHVHACPFWHYPPDSWPMLSNLALACTQLPCHNGIFSLEQECVPLLLASQSASAKIDLQATLLRHFSVSNLSFIKTYCFVMWSAPAKMKRTLISQIRTPPMMKQMQVRSSMMGRIGLGTTLLKVLRTRKDCQWHLQ